MSTLRTLFLAAGFKLRVYDPADSDGSKLRAYIDNAWPAVTELGMTNAGDPDNYSLHANAAEAVEGALKIAYKSRKERRRFILHADDSFHGKTIASGSITGSQSKVWDFPKLPDTAAFKRNDLASVEALNQAVEHDVFKSPSLPTARTSS